MLDNFEIKKSNHIVASSICIVKVEKKYITGFIHSIEDKDIVVTVNGKVKTLKSSEIFHIYYTNPMGKELLLSVDKRNYDKILKLKGLMQGKSRVEISKSKLENINYIRSLKHLEESNGIASIIIPLEVDKNQVGYLMKRAVDVAKGDHAKATVLFIEDLKKFNLSIVNT